LHVDGSAKSAIIREVQRHPLSRRALHVDFLVVDLLQEMEVDVPLVFTGEPPAVELTGGTLMTPIGHLRVRALPTELPHEISVEGEEGAEGAEGEAQAGEAETNASEDEPGG